MKKQFAILALFGVLIFGSFTLAMAQEGDSTQTGSEQTEAVSSEQDQAPVMDVATDATTEEASFHQRIKEKFIEGGAPFMWPILICLIFGLAVSIERIITLNLA
ncbi:MAG TPA: MotA/TolQ/ExbB proton channel family protein, partial [Cyclobacteriaceae bacterium]|nr:MotA/TolQ/ExbB proton channel family protein [Cyclobacteriaceae bacterium]